MREREGLNMAPIHVVRSVGITEVQSTGRWVCLGRKMMSFVLRLMYKISKRRRIIYL